MNTITLAKLLRVLINGNDYPAGTNIVNIIQQMILHIILIIEINQIMIMNHMSLWQNINMKFLKYLITLNLILFIFLDQKHLIQTNIYYIEKHSVCLYFLIFFKLFLYERYFRQRD